MNIPLRLSQNNDGSLVLYTRQPQFEQHSTQPEESASIHLAEPNVPRENVPRPQPNTPSNIAYLRELHHLLTRLDTLVRGLYIALAFIAVILGGINIVDILKEFRFL